jgi:hypothetical protein
MYTYFETSFGREGNSLKHKNRKNIMQVYRSIITLDCLHISTWEIEPASRCYPLPVYAGHIFKSDLFAYLAIIAIFQSQK